MLKKLVVDKAMGMLVLKNAARAQACVAQFNAGSRGLAVGRWSPSGGPSGRKRPQIKRSYEEISSA
jgi:hypothetical protein